MKHFITCAITLFWCISHFAQDQPVFCQQLQASKDVILTQHYASKAIDDSLSKGVFYLFLNKLDEEKDFFFQEDIDVFKADEFELDNYINENNCSFSAVYAKILENRYRQAYHILEKLKDTIFDYSGKVTLTPVAKKDYKYFSSEKKFTSYLSKKIAYNTLRELLSQNDSISTQDKNFTDLEIKARHIVINRELCQLNTFLNQSNGVINFVNNQFLSAYFNYQDPNSEYFSANEKEDYEGSLSTNQESFGIIPKKTKNGEIAIDYIIPGSSAYKNGTLNEDDIILELTSDEDQLVVTCLSLEELSVFLNKENHTTTQFLIKDKNNNIKEVTLTKSEIKVTENAVRGFILGDKTKIGYIKIPSFYTDFDSKNGRGVSADIAKELYKLQKEGIEALVLDLQFNGGGSMQEAINLSGMFIDKGPLAILKFKDQSTYTIRDPRRGTFFNKPIAILVNDYSASASEFFTAAMQDYNRALVVGSKTFGKSTAQNIVPLKEGSDLGFCKITVEMFFRVSGNSHQAIGITPDIELPSLYKKMNVSEASKAFVIPNDRLDNREYYKAFIIKNLKELKENSSKRTSNNSYFNSIENKGEMLYKLVNVPTAKYALSINGINERIEKRKKAYDTIFSENDIVLTPVTNTKATEEFIIYNTDDKNENDFIINNLSKDIYINETFNILLDYLNL
ncbi:carboxy terminal-processing peptidase [Aurantibacter aestuarii]|uniref:Tail specific protease domain-containing protein n=1 Tax=Aurantibacter aestuarii TaxID=1266046 RepID=A0A2T1N917_9FLAO|nr:carboxy terminal-processing peptidase [Aurantibacter aestuarii]PSG88377.1 hypothetical protein C7H52_08735 [Aurantibacter aestuarii]